MHRVTYEQTVQILTFFCLYQRAQFISYSIFSHSCNYQQLSLLIFRVESFGKGNKQILINFIANLNSYWILQASKVLYVRPVDLSCSLSNPDHMRRKTVMFIVELSCKRCLIRNNEPFMRSEQLRKMVLNHVMSQHRIIVSLDKFISAWLPI